jgi:BirA family transcriptional regulator, biotin operon repressor / biotin---[acetyl-CoA-carboxylase] ligase
VDDDGPGRPPLDPEAGLPPGEPGRGGRVRWRLEVLEESPSTNAYVAGRARDGEAAGLVVAAEHQTAGRGRLDRSWVTPPRAALTFSLLLTPDEVPVHRWPWLPLLTGLAVAEGVERAAGVGTRLKWPNDVLADEAGAEAKVAGVLVERVERPGVEPPPGAAAVVGVGLNVTTTRAELPVPTATSLALAGAASTDRSALLRSVLEAFARRYDEWCGCAGGGLRPSYVRACGTLGRQVRVALPAGGALVGRAVDVDEEGRLLVDDGSRVHVLGAGDVVHVRPDRPRPGERMRG